MRGKLAAERSDTTREYGARRRAVAVALRHEEERNVILYVSFAKAPKQAKQARVRWPPWIFQSPPSACWMHLLDRRKEHSLF